MSKLAKDVIPESSSTATTIQPMRKPPTAPDQGQVMLKAVSYKLVKLRSEAGATPVAATNLKCLRKLVVVLVNGPVKNMSNPFLKGVTGAVCWMAILTSSTMNVVRLYGSVTANVGGTVISTSPTSSNEILTDVKNCKPDNVLTVPNLSVLGFAAAKVSQACCYKKWTQWYNSRKVDSID